jgi:hypothetical protein
LIWNKQLVRHEKLPIVIGKSLILDEIRNYSFLFVNFKQIWQMIAPEIPFQYKKNPAMGNMPGL